MTWSASIGSLATVQAVCCMEGIGVDLDGSVKKYLNSFTKTLDNSTRRF